MIHKKKGEIEWLEFELLASEPHVTHGVFLRSGGVSIKPQFASLNIMKGSGDDLIHVEENRKRIQKSLELEHLIGVHQVHGKDVVLVRDPDATLLPHDGLITDQKKRGLLIVHADCQATFFYDPIHLAIANVHAGWRGQGQNIYKETIQKMKTQFGTRAEDLLVCISPSLGPDHSEFIHYQKELPSEFWDFQIKPYYFDLWSIAKYQLQASGILPHHIQIAYMDTYNDPEKFFSYRREKANGLKTEITGGHGSVIALK